MNRQPYYYVVLCRTLLSLLKLFVTQRESIYSRCGNPIFPAKQRIVIVCLREMQQSKPRHFFLFILFVSLKSIPSALSKSFFSFIENPIPLPATMCLHKQLSQRPIMWVFSLVSTMKGFGKSCQISVFYNNGLQWRGHVWIVELTRDYLVMMPLSSLPGFMFKTTTSIRTNGDKM